MGHLVTKDFMGQRDREQKDKTVPIKKEILSHKCSVSVIVTFVTVFCKF